MRNRDWEIRFYLRSVDADKRVFGVADFPKGVWVEVPKKVWEEFCHQPGWEGRQRK